MDLLYSKYASPMELLKIYIAQGRFGELVASIIDIDNRQKKEKTEKENDDRLWDIYIRSMSNKTFVEWKKEIASLSRQEPKNYSMSDEEVKDTMNRARGILKGFNMN